MNNRMSAEASASPDSSAVGSGAVVSTSVVSVAAEVWIDADGYRGDVVAVLNSVRSAGFPAERTLVMTNNRAGLTAAADAVCTQSGVTVVTATAAVLNARLARTTSDRVIWVRGGAVHPDLMSTVGAFCERFDTVDVVYGDSVEPSGHPVRRPLFSPLRLRSHDYLGAVVVFRVSMLKTVGGFRAAARGAYVLDLVLRAQVAGDEVELLPVTLATADPASSTIHDDAAETAVVARHLRNLGSIATIETVLPGVRRVRYAIIDTPLVSIVIPTRGSRAVIAGRERTLVVEAVRGIMEHSTYRNIEIVVVADADTPEPVIESLEEICGNSLRLVLWDAPFNFSAKVNRGAAVASGQYLLILNDDVEIVSGDWIDTMVGLIQQPGVGLVGAELFFEDSMIQHGGQLYAGGQVGHAAFEWPGGVDDPIWSLHSDREVSGVTAACLLIARDLFETVGGMTSELPGNYNDVDLNLKVRETGLVAVYSPWARLYHFESKTRDPRILASDTATLRARWASRIEVEMYSRSLMVGPSSRAVSRLPQSSYKAVRGC
ncbi:MAG: hypothetical protein B5766_04745 [Candidatus Lumbricidophila eiseniae]|uniref:Glycosyltransferase 2-like domain-containing protein n=1 Tax=Candidatus Lumbricidiphila eiseniae TaxID=1969409 RepID=A0A2A6FSB0_9MICO|nr:MAG: hypothetical protein B5766_04745 [Candidatus Lumbricidophila eiseniae]